MDFYISILGLQNEIWDYVFQVFSQNLIYSLGLCALYFADYRSILP